MPPRFFIYFTAFLLFPFLLTSQVSVFGKFAIGDTSNYHLLRTVNDDQFLGTVTSWSSDSLIFRSYSNVLISFPVSSLKSIEVTQKEAVGSTTSSEVFLLKTRDGRLFYGYPKKFLPDKIVFDAGKAGTMSFKPEAVASIEAETGFTFEKEPFVNDYLLKDTKGKKAKTRLLGFVEGNVMYEDTKGQQHKLLKGIKKFELQKPYQPCLGYGRSLMFAPTGFGMTKRQSEYRNIEYFINSFAFGLNDHLSAGVGLVSILPYADMKLSYSLGKYVHWSVGAYVFAPISAGYHTSLSVGTPDYFINLSYLNNKAFAALQSDSDFDNFSFGASLRSGRRSRLFAEFNILTSPVGEFGGYDSFYGTGYGNSFSWGYGYFSRKFRFEVGVMGIGPFERFSCFNGNCNDYYHLPIPFFSFGVLL